MVVFLSLGKIALAQKSEYERQAGEDEPKTVNDELQLQNESLNEREENIPDDAPDTQDDELPQKVTAFGFISEIADYGLRVVDNEQSEHHDPLVGQMQAIGIGKETIFEDHAQNLHEGENEVVVELKEQDLLEGQARDWVWAVATFFRKFLLSELLFWLTTGHFLSFSIYK